MPERFGALLEETIRAAAIGCALAGERLTPKQIHAIELAVAKGLATARRNARIDPRPTPMHGFDTLNDEDTKPTRRPPPRPAHPPPPPLPLGVRKRRE